MVGSGHDKGAEAAVAAARVCVHMCHKQMRVCVRACARACLQRGRPLLRQAPAQLVHDGLQPPRRVRRQRRRAHHDGRPNQPATAGVSAAAGPGVAGRTAGRRAFRGATRSFPARGVRPARPPPSAHRDGDGSVDLDTVDPRAKLGPERDTCWPARPPARTSATPPNLLVLDGDHGRNAGPGDGADGDGQVLPRHLRVVRRYVDDACGRR
jgi:hypothetical protein